MMTQERIVPNPISRLPETPDAKNGEVVFKRQGNEVSKQDLPATTKTKFQDLVVVGSHPFFHSEKWVSLDLDGTQTTDADLRKVAKLSTLNELGLRGTPITDAGLKELVVLKNLEQLYLFNTGIRRGA